jgi:hypothetical protein
MGVSAPARPLNRARVPGVDPMASVSAAPPVRTGKCRLVLRINESEYVVRRVKSPCRGGAVWHLRKSGGPLYCVSRLHGCIACTCPDQSRRGARCKHIGALQALGFISRRLRVSPPFSFEGGA